MNKLSIISESGEGEIIINENGESYSLYKNEEIQKPLSITDSMDRPIYSSELNERLKRRIWNTPERRYIKLQDNSEGELMLFKGIADEYINTINDKDSSIGVPVCNLIGISESEIEKFREEFKDILKDMTGKEIYIHNASKEIIDVLNDSITVNLLISNSDVYTNTFNLGNLVKDIPYPGVSGKIDLSIQYSKGGYIYNYDTTFEGFGFNFTDSMNDLEMTNSDFVEKIGEDIVIEYLDSMLRIIPISKDVVECIISNCTMTYGNIKQ